MNPTEAAAFAGQPIRVTVNGKPHAGTVAAQTLLVDFLREQLGLTGTHQGCDTAQCGACTVLVDGAATKACNLLALQVDGGSITTIEGLANEGLAGETGEPHPLQLAFSAHHALQCGYCTPGMILRGVSIVADGTPADPAAVREALAGNLCRCTGYRGIVEAICTVIRQRDAR